MNPSSVPSFNPSLAPSQCQDEPSYIWDQDFGFGCSQLPANACADFADVWVNGNNTYLSCCVCGGGENVVFHPTRSMVPRSSPSLPPSAPPSADPSAAPSEPSSLESQVNPQAFHLLLYQGALHHQLHLNHHQ